MNMDNMKEYLAQHETRQIMTGKSGADVYEIDGKYILKYVRREKLKHDELYSSYRKEVLFYQSSDKAKGCFLPEVLELKNTDDELVILMKKYEGLKREEISRNMLQKIMRTLVMIHTGEIPFFLRKDSIQERELPVSCAGNEEEMHAEGIAKAGGPAVLAGCSQHDRRKTAGTLSKRQIEEAVNGWESVLAEHAGAFDQCFLKKTAEKINEIILWHDGEEEVLTHGDFHWDNLLTDKEGNIVVCDWQNTGVGKASGDASFFLSRLRADGLMLDEEDIVELYQQAVWELTGRRINKNEFSGHRKAADLITTFVFWHQYLHGSSEERVREIYGRMDWQI